MVKVKFAPALSFAGTRIPLTVYPLPVTVSPETVTVVLPELRIVTVADCVRPTRTLPKSTERVLNLNCPSARAIETPPAAHSANAKINPHAIRRGIWLKDLKEAKWKEPTRGPRYLMTFPVFGNDSARSTELAPLS